MRTLTSLFAVATLAACSSVQSNPIPIAGPMTSLAGEWTGSYASTESGRAGGITFTLVGGEDHAHGDVIMIPNGQPPLRHAQDMQGGSGPTMPPSHVLTIEFVRASGDSVSGTLAPYTDPDCDCTVLTTFTGRVTGDMIEGTFATRRPRATVLLRGSWMVRRRQPSLPARQNP